MRTGVTTIRHADSSIIKEAQKRSEALGFPYIPRGDTLEEMTEETGLSGFLIYGRQLPLYWSDGEEYRFHMGTAVPRNFEKEILTASALSFLRTAPVMCSTAPSGRQGTRVRCHGF